MDGDEGGGRWVDGGQLFKHQGGIEPGQGKAARAFGRIQAAKAQLARAADGVAGKDGVAVPFGSVRSQLGLRELARGICKGALVF
ncbi:hypothetical protein D3C72_1668830 [compost metagenome]